MKWSDESIFQLIEQYEKKEFLYKNSQSQNPSLLCLPISFAGKVCHGFRQQTTGACFCRQKQAPENGQRVINFIARNDTKMFRLHISN